jgi:hypothetical protein
LAAAALKTVSKLALLLLLLLDVNWPLPWLLLVR